MPKKEIIQLKKTNARLAKQLLQKKRELKIESSLEKVRVMAMAMTRRDDMLTICKAISAQLKLFGVKEIRNVQTAIIYKEKGIYMNYEYYTKHRKTLITETSYGTSKLDRDFANKMLKGKGEIFFSHLKGKKVKEWLDFQKTTNVFIDKFLETATTLNYYWYSLGPVALGVSTYHPLSKNEQGLFHRFVNVFELAYRKYLDIENAETQAREAQIQASLEKVRSGSLAMHKSDELKEAGELLWDELRRLGIKSLSSGYVIMDEDEKIGWTYAPNPATGKINEPLGLVHTETSEMRKVLSSWEKKEPLSIIEMNEQETIAHQTFIAENGLQKDGTNSHWITAEQLIALSPKRLSLQNFNFKQGYLMIVGGKRLNESEIELMLRFTKVFQQTYTRFLDLQKAEAQTREAQIEAALERVRVRTMAMQKSAELSEAAYVIFQQLKVLGENPIQCTIGIMNEKERVIEFSVTDWAGGGRQIDLLFKASFDEPALINKSYTAWKEKRKSLVVDLRGPELEAWLTYRTKISGTKATQEDTSGRRVVTLAFFSKGHLSISSPEPRPKETILLLERFAAEFDMTYTRFLDLQNSEAQTRQAIQRASVDRIRAEIASMRTTTDLERITPLIWNELTTIGVPFIRCGVFIMDEEQQQINIFLSTPEGRGVAAAFYLPYTANRETVQIVSHWNKKEMYSTHWDEAAFNDFTKVLGERGAITTGEKFLVESRPDDLYLHFLPFQQGMLYVGDTQSLSNEHLPLVQALAEAFSTAYLRYEDFNKLESAKDQIEKTLVDLRQAQSQLVQSEKMASLGELTAGIAHEIQNPLNFVNNFSEVNAELIEELTAERAKPKTERDEKLENEILDNIKQNLEKINNHGKRADGIVKGMLQHSRSSSGQKELTDINALADEYLRLAYHGFRAKEKYFNAKLETDFDKNIKKINVVSQDIGRVLLNLINNAFYAVYEKRKGNDAGFEPLVKLATRQSDNQLFITLSDNGNGIPKNIVDKIFQPFFTTKPTGSGTGLGLSLAYDIIKAHGGDIKVATREGEGTEFTIHLPAV
ncbi:MAG TPA: ATP-binding protein [Chitinophagaceae bacterium]|nr:ATP-binding protein [Chitinophagaceae bacterium]